MPTRKIKSSPVKVTGTAPDGQSFESTVEEDFFFLLRFNRLVKSFEDNPVTIDWMDENREMRRYTPDVLVHYKEDETGKPYSPPILCEIKPFKEGDAPSTHKRYPPRTENHPENKLKWAAAERYARKQGWEFKVFYEKDIRTEYFTNARFLLRHVEKMHDSKHQYGLLQALAERGPMTLHEWMQSQKSTGNNDRLYILPACYRLIGLQMVDVDLNSKLTFETMIRPMENIHVD
jgi:hypothetical protein